ncbi:protein FAR1-RELATED SEQUENCE 5-like [Rosa rugosa]|uniref:protein FAR1-RELATED SEQUENCE 5-like n=1 Tax=Rosa rugosa TaxID=74645 RepID=UPI002B40E7D9|nr:protein FAR1-RELATED SEQUENCE 5-like [Rosa rugosa]
MESEDDHVYIPQVKAELMPKLHQEYAKKAGFSIRSHSSATNKDNTQLMRKEYVCYKQGTSKVEGEKRKRGLPKVGCKARIAVVRKKEYGRYAISVFVEGYNHPLTSPPRVHLLRSHRRVLKVNTVLSQQLSLVNVQKHTQFEFFGVQAGGIENIGCTQRDLYNYGRTCREAKKGHDGDLLYMHFQNEKEKDSSFVYTIESDEENRVTRCFWADSISRRAYSFYGDVVIFDTTYNTNRYGMIFAPFTGVNNHGQTIIFACAFLNDETADSFVWLFKELLNAMPGNAPENAPKMIITDQDPAMTKAISEALPQTFHRYCSWHILNKFSEKLDAIKYRDYYQDFHSCIWNSSSREEFDSRWIEITEKSGLSDNKWLESIYEIRSSWIPAHFKRGLLHQRHYELEEDHINIDEKPKTVMSLDIEDHMAKVYTRKLFYEVQEQLKECFKYKLELLRENVTHCVFKVMRKNIDTCKSRELTYEKVSDFASCSCRKFESEGLPCRHVLSYLIKIQDIDKLPIQYILKRWTKAARQSLVLDSDGMEVKDNKALLARRTKLFQHATDAIDKAMVSDEASQLFMECLDAFLENLKTLIGNESGQSAVVLETKIDAIQHIFNEPNQVRAKGCGRRLKKGKEKRKVKVKESQGRQCHGCGLFGQSHDKRNCPTLHGKPAINKDGESSSTSMDEDGCSSTGELFPIFPSIYDCLSEIFSHWNLPLRNALAMELDNMANLSDKCNFQIPMEVIKLIDNGKNPDLLTRDLINSCNAKNLITKGKTDTFKSLREHQLEELDQAFPDEVESYREIRAAASAISCIALITQSRLCAHPRNVTRVF